MTFFDTWKHLNSLFNSYNPSPHTQLVGYKLLTICNERMLPEEFTVTDRELQQRTGIKSVESIVSARRYLKQLGLIDFNAKKAGTTYRFCQPSTNRAQAEQDSSTKQAPTEHPSRSTPLVSSAFSEKTKTGREDVAGAREEEGGKIDGDDWRSFRQFNS